MNHTIDKSSSGVVHLGHMSNKSEILKVRITPDMLRSIDAVPALTRAEAVRKLIEAGLSQIRPALEKAA